MGKDKYYISHEEGFRKFREKGKYGWYTKERQDEMLGILVRLLEKDYVPKSGRLLEMGCGDGEKSLFFSSRGFEVVGVDLSPTAVEWAREKAKQRGLSATFLVDDVCGLVTQPDASFDFVMDGHCLHCIVGEGRRLFLGAARRVLKPCGFFRVETMTQPVLEAGKHCVPPLTYDPATRTIFLKGEPFRYVGEVEEIREELNRAGFDELAREIVEPDLGKEDRWTGGIQIDLRKRTDKEW